jgi:thiamine biosynthesis lipoprotein ApbE
MAPKEKHAIATSGTFKRENSKILDHHIINPVTLQPAKSDILLSTICAKDGVMADILASCAVIIGSEDAPQFLNNMNIDNWLLQVKTTSGSSKIIKSGTLFETVHNDSRKEAINA